MNHSIRRTLVPVLFASVILLGLATVARADNVHGTFSPVGNWPLITVHTVMLPDGRILSYGSRTDGRQTGYFEYDVWDPAAGGIDVGHVLLPNQTGTDIFCGSQVVLPQSGQVVLNGGDIMANGGSTNVGNNNTNIFNPLNNSLTRGNNLNRARWYSSSTVLLNGEVYVQGGNGGADRPEVRQLDGTYRLLSGVDTSALSYDFPRNFVAPDGRVFGYDSGGNMYYVNTAATGLMTAVGQTPGASRGGDSTVVMFRPGRILQMGGSSNGAVVIDINSGSPVATATNNMATMRKLANATVVADGRVVVTGGSEVWNQLTGVNKTAEIWNPTTGAWTIGATAVKSRLYHSGSVLLPDASVLVSGGGAPGPEVNTNAEIYYPPYLYDSAGAFAARPGIAAAPTQIEIGATFPVDYANAASISRVTLIKSASVTHSFNMEQRFAELTFNTVGNRLMVQAPTKASQATPGYYMLFVIDGNGVPSKARILKVGIAANPSPAITPTVTQPADQSSVSGISVSLQIQASDPNGDVLGYAAVGLPPGVVLDSTSGLISGTPNTIGDYNVTVAASDGINNDSKIFIWHVTQVEALILNSLAPPPPAIYGNSATYTASTSNGVNVLYRWNFGDGTGDTGWSSSNSISHLYTAPGVYYATVRAIDDRGVERSQTFVQRVHLPTIAGKPMSSATIAWQTRAGANPLVWSVNQDNDSISVFDGSTYQRLRELAVGLSPRTVAVAANGLVWVANRDSDSLSVIDSATQTVTRTVALQRGSRPYGIVISPDGNTVYVASEGLGRLQMLNAASGAVLATTTLPPGQRHVAISADGSKLYVPRFVTGRLPGEATATVTTEADGLIYGAELRVLSAADLSAISTAVLRHSELPDFENSGRGIPNYLGSMAISPDGVSGWVPSKQDNIKRGVLRSGQSLNFQNTVRAISSRIDLGSATEDYVSRIDHDNAGVASAAAFDPQGVYMFVALETSREVAVVNAYGRAEMFRIQTGRAPQGLVVSPDGRKLFVSNFMDRSVTVFDLGDLMERASNSAPLLATMSSIGTEKLASTVLRGKQLFYDAKDTRLARDAYISCAACHNSGGQDGRVWDLTGFGEGLRNTIGLEGRAAGHGFLHWSSNFDELQDFEGQIRNLSGGTGLMTDAQFNSGTRNQPLGDPKTGVSTDLDALAAYVASLNTFAVSPYRNSDGTLTARAQAGRLVFAARNCAACHAGTNFTNSLNASTLSNIGTIKASSGQRLAGPLTGIDPPTLRDVFRTAPWLHDGSAGTIQQAIQMHNNVSLTATELDDVTAYLQQIGSDEPTAPTPTNFGAGLAGAYFNNTKLSGSPVLQRIEVINFDWGTGAPGSGVGTNKFSVRWSGAIEIPATGSYRLQTLSDDGARVYVDGVRIINSWSDHSATRNTSSARTYAEGRHAITVEYYENSGSAVMKLYWLLPGTTTYDVVPVTRLYN
jgi:YVTN family beta-propeller protein